MPLNVDGFLRVQAGLPAAIDTGAHRGAGFVGDLAQQLAPEESGDLKASMRVYAGDEPGIYIVSFGEGLPDIRAIAQEDGTIYMDPQPYLSPALKRINVRAEIAKEVRALIQGSR